MIPLEKTKIKHYSIHKNRIGEQRSRGAGEEEGEGGACLCVDLAPLA